MHTDVVVIGGGISGLVTALHCIMAGYRVVILEKNQRFGGRIHTIIHKNWKYEAGAGRISSHHHRALALLRAFGMHLTKMVPDKEYRDIQCQSTPHHKNPTAHLVKKVCDKAKHIPRETLQQMTFGMLCHQILGPQKADRLVSAFGYDAEFEHLNAWDGLEMFRRDFAQKKNIYYTCTEGLGVWVDRIVSYIQRSNMASLLSGYQAYQWKRKNNGTMMVTARNMDGVSMTMTANVIVCAIPKKELMDTFTWSPYHQRLLDSVQEIPLHRIYGKFPAHKQKPWFSGIPTTTTNADVRQFIPVNAQHGLAMMSYSDSLHANRWQNYAGMGDSSLRNALLQQLHVVFPEVPNIPKPTWIHSHYWDAGVHMWKPGVDSQKVSTELIQPFGTHMPLFVVGESYSRHQAWIEGALETVDEAIPRIMDILNKVHGGTSVLTLEEWIATKKGRLRKTDLEQMKTMFPNESWVILENKVIRVTEWMNIHPGGRAPFEQNMYTDITHIFQTVGSHKAPDGMGINSHVKKMIDKYTIATLI